MSFVNELPGSWIEQLGVGDSDTGPRLRHASVLAAQTLVHDLGRYRIQVMNADGSDLHPLLRGEEACCETEWSSLGDRILYMVSAVAAGSPVTGRLDSEVWTVSPDGSNRIKIFHSDGCEMGDNDDALPVWAPTEQTSPTTPAAFG